MKKVIVIGGGTAGVSIAARLKNEIDEVKIDLFDPSATHYYQPLYTLVGAGADPKEKTTRSTKDVIPKGVNWIQRKIVEFYPDENKIKCSKGDIHEYDYLVVAPGIQLDWNLVEGLEENLGKNGVCSVYGYQASEDTFKALKNFKGGKAVFTAAGTPVKCGGASQKIMYLAESFLSKNGLRAKTDIIFASAGTTIFGVPGFKEALQKVVDKKNIDTRFFHDLYKIDGENKTAYFNVKKFENDQLVGTESVQITYDLLHVVPPQSAPDFIKNSPLSIKSNKLKGWLDVNHFTLQHNQYPNVFGLGDACGLPTAKTGAAIRKQLPVVANNIVRLMNGESIDENEVYNGYSACPILTDYSHVLLAEFEYGNKPKPSFFFNTKKPMWLMYLLKHYFLPWFYWNRMLKGKG